MLRWLIASACTWGIVASLLCPVAAHEPDEEGHGHRHGHTPAQGDTTGEAPKFPRGLILPVLEGPKPWSEKPVLNDPDRFQIAIMTDNTGGHRPGIWMQAVRKLNLLRPEFVMSVGDLIEGYSEDRNEVEQEWQEFLGFINELDMRFFFVAGNHDVTNPLMHKVWREHFGPEWYSFDYRGVHFLCLSSEDPDDRIGDEQLAWIEKDLAAHATARWTLLFFHKPMWVTSERAVAAGNPDPTNWQRVEELLGSRPHTVFAGHVHHYVQYDRRGMKYYHLATTGGSSRLRGVPYGEFDQVTWLTMEKDGPSVANLLLDGILPPDAVTEQGIARFRDFLAKTQIEVVPILLDDEAGFSNGRIELRLTNGLDRTVEMTGRIDGLPLRGLSVDRPAIALRAEAGTVAELSVNVRFGEKILFEHLSETLLVARLTTPDDERPLSAERVVPVVIDRSHRCPMASPTVDVDGQLAEWADLPWATGNEPLVLGAAEQWQGPGDARITFGVSHDADWLFLAGRVTDDSVRVGDGVEFRLDARPIDVRKSNPALAEGTYYVRVAPGPEPSKAVLEVRGAGLTSARLRAAVRRTATGYDWELSVPLEVLKRFQGPSPQGFQLTPIVVDVDQPDEMPCRVVWRGTADVDQRNTNYGQFVLAP